MMGLFSTVPGCTWLYPAVPGSALVYHDLPCHRLPLTGLNAFVYTGFNAMKLYVGWVGWIGLKISECISAMDMTAYRI